MPILKIQYRVAGGTYVDFPGSTAIGSVVGFASYYDSGSGTQVQGVTSTPVATTSGPGSPTVYEFRLVGYTDTNLGRQIIQSSLYCSWVP